MGQSSESSAGQLSPSCEGLPNGEDGVTELVDDETVIEIDIEPSDGAIEPQNALKCALCSKSFARRDALKQHIRNHVDAGQEELAEYQELSPGARKLLANATRDKLSLVHFLQESGCLDPTPPRCPTCSVRMRLKRRGKTSDGYRWACTRDNATLSVRHGSIFEQSRLTLKTLTKLAFFWYGGLSNARISRLLNLSQVSVINYTRLFRSVCASYFSENPTRIGGPGLDVQIDALACKKDARVDEPTERYFVCHCPATNDSVILYVTDMTADTILSLIERHILPGSVIHSDRKPAYSSISQLDVAPTYGHVTVGNTDDFVCPLTGGQINYAKWLASELEFKLDWSRLSKAGICNSRRQNYVDEFMWRRKFGGQNDVIGLQCWLRHTSLVVKPRPV